MILLRTKLVLASSLLPMAQMLWAAEPNAAMPATEFSGAGHLLQVTVGLILVLAMILAVAWIARRTGAVRGVAGGQLRVLGALSMGQRERVVLVQVGDTQLLVGVAPGQVRTLHVLDQPLSVTEFGGFSSKDREPEQGADSAENGTVPAQTSVRAKLRPALFGNSFAAKLEAALSERMGK